MNLISTYVIQYKRILDCALFINHKATYKKVVN